MVYEFLKMYSLTIVLGLLCQLIMYMRVIMTDVPPEQETPCLCVKVVPEGKRIDYDQIVTDERTGKQKWKTMLRAHQDCPEHGLIETKETE